MTVDDLQRTLQAAFPLESAMPGDNVGLQIRGTSKTVQSALCCMEVTDDVVSEANELGVEAIITFHPLIYSPLTRLDGSDRVSRLVLRCIQSDLSVYCVHTAFDAHPRGTNRLLADKLGLTAIRTIDPNPRVQIEADVEVGMGLLASCDLDFDELLARVTAVCGPSLRYSPAPKQQVRTVALVAGSGMSFYDKVVGTADVFITADVKYHAFHAATGRIGLIDAGHYEMEQFVAKGMAQELERHTSSFKIHVSSVCPNPVRYGLPQNVSEIAFSEIS
jgi:dinuclear metal center YbgI/SA1388 family protein